MCVIAGFALLQTIRLASASNTILHTFAGEPTDGRSPSGGMTLSNNVFYGTTRYGGAHNNGIIFRMNPDGSGYSILHHFAGGMNDGSDPTGTLVVAGSTIYGTTMNGGSNNAGTVFSIDTSGSNLALLHTFPTGMDDGTLPPGPLVLVDSTLYGVTEQGGTDNLGTIFKINTDSTGYAILHSFASGTSDGHLPIAGLTLAGSTLYGTTAQGGTSGNNAGTLFKIDLTGTGYMLLHSFTGIHGDGDNPEHTLTLFASTLYGVTNQGGTAGTGTIFKIDASGTGYGVLYSFEGSTGNDGHPSSALTAFEDHLIGSTDPMDANIPGLVYSVGLNGSGFGTLYRFNGPTTEGREPGADLAVIGSTMYGVTGFGGTGRGVIYALALPTPTILSVNHPDNSHFSLTGQAFPNSAVAIDFSPNLATEFMLLDTVMSDANGMFGYIDSTIAGDSMKFYEATSQ
jgi:uncharacterized repeat protein (TIGR03803 family)